MQLSSEGKLVRTDIWREGEYVDLWSIPHLLSGAVTGLVAYFVGFEPLPTFIIVFILLCGYEMFEALVKIEETKWNRTLDVIIGMASFAPTFLLAPLYLSHVQLGASLGFLFVFNSFLSWFGWYESKKASVLEAKLLSQIEMQRARLRERRRARRAGRAARLAQSANEKPIL